MARLLKVGLIGYGMIGKVHAFAYRTLPFYAPELTCVGEVVRVVTAHQESAAAAAAQLGISEFGTDYHEITEDPSFDVVHICTPNADHLGPLLSAIENQKAIYCEKPLTCTAPEAEAVEATIKKYSYTRTSQMAFHLRSFTAIRRARQLIQEGRLGTILRYRLGYFHSSNVSALAPYKWKHGASGGVLRDLGSHLMDLLDFLIGLPTEVFADEQILYSERCTLPGEQKMPCLGEDTITILTRHQKPGEPLFTGTVEATKLATGCEDELRLELHGTQGAIRFSLMDPHYLDFFDATASDKPYGGDSGWIRIACGGRYEAPDASFPSPKSTTGWIRAHVASISHFLQSYEAEERGEPDLLQGCRIQHALEKIALSQGKRWSSLELGAW